MLSGDVHFAELLTAQPPPSDDPNTITPPEVLEVTSSGMTHTCMNTALGMCQLAMETYNEHRASKEAYYGKFNYGTIEFDWPATDDDEEESEQQDPLKAAGIIGHYVVKVRNVKQQTKLELEKTIGPDYPMPDIGKPYTLNDNALLLYVAALILVIWTVLAVMVCKMCTGSRSSKTKKGSASSSWNGHSSNGSSNGSHESPVVGRVTRSKAKEA